MLQFSFWWCLCDLLQDRLYDLMSDLWSTDRDGYDAMNRGFDEAAWASEGFHAV